MVVDDVRSRSRAALSNHGLAVPDALPTVQVTYLRPLEEVLERLFCLNAVAASAYGFDAGKALSWLHQQDLYDNLTQPERAFLEKGEGDPYVFKIQVEGMWAIAWAVNIVTSMDFWQDCKLDFVTLLPNLKKDEGVTRTSSGATLRDSEQIAVACDLAYCLHWIIQESLIKNQSMPHGLKPYIVIERRRALDWMSGKDDWDMVSLDT
jgi:hypothetical protein